MKKLTKLRLINWHYFQNIECEFEMINFLTGENAAGKSTIIDAMQVVLLGDTGGRSFNKAANEKSGRTLKGYLRCEVGDNDDGSTRFLRTGRFTSYIALEFFDDVVNQNFCVGCVFDVFDDGSEQHRFFYLEDKFPDNHFIVDRVPMSQKKLQEYFLANYAEERFIFCDTNAQYQRLIKEKFGNLGDKYFTLFKKAVSFIPITNIEQFITEYVCDVPNDINIESMKENISCYERLKLEAGEMQVKIDALEKIHSAYENVVNTKRDMLLSSYVSDKISINVSLELIDNLRDTISQNEEQIKDIDRSLEEIDKNIDALNAEKESLLASKYSSKDYNLISSLEKTCQDAERKLKATEDEISSLYGKINNYVTNFSNFSARIYSLTQSGKEHEEDKDILDSLKHLELECINLDKILKKIKDVINNKDILEKELFNEFSQAIIDFKNVVIEEYSVLSKTVGKAIAQISQQKQTLTTSSNGKYYDDAFIRVKNQLMQALEDHYHEKVNVYCYADLVDIKNKRWINAIEGFIASQKLNLIVEDKYYIVANKLLKNILARNNYSRTGLVDIKKLSEHHFTAENNSLAEEIVTDHQGARDYTNFLIGRLIKCDTFEEARESGRGITSDCEVYRNFASYFIPPHLYRYPIIGRSVSKEVRDERLKALDKESLSLEALKSLIETLRQARDLDTMSNDEQKTCLDTIEKNYMLPQLRENVKRYKDELSFGSNDAMNAIDMQISRIEEDIKNQHLTREQLILNKGNLQSAIKVLKEETIPQKTKSCGEEITKLEEKYSKEWREEVGDPYLDNEMNKGLSTAEIRSHHDEEYSKYQYRLRIYNEQLKDLRSQYVITYKLSYDIVKEDNDDFERDLISLRDVKLPQYLVRIEDAHQKAIKEFRDDFIYKLKTAIENARTQINDLNEALKDAKFGNDSYEFTVVPNPQYIEYYNMITDELLLDVNLDEDAFMLKHQPVMENLFRLISDDGDSKDKASKVAENIARFTDYRSYLIFDLKVKKPDGRSFALSRNIKKASGGETQTPFYISILASFSQLYRVKANKSVGNSIRLVIFDEAFSKMDRNRIVESIKILKDFDLQVIISAPPEKVNDISNLVNETLVVTRTGSVSHVDKFIYHEE